MGTLMSHVEQLADVIGPRPATTDAEERAATYIREIFESHGLDAETQSFDSPRTYSWAYVIYYVLAIVAAVGSHWSAWPALILAIATAAVFRFDLDTRWGLTALMPKGPSQNVIARHTPKAGRGERVARVVVVAHYDSARSSWAFSPGMVKNFEVTFGLMKGCMYAIPVLIALRMLPYLDKFEPWSWYLTLVPAAYLLVPLVINIERETLGKFTPGANDNASGVAAMLGVLERLVPEPEATAFVAREAVKMRTQEEAIAADVVPEDSLLNYSPVAAPPRAPESWAEDDDISWDTGVIAGQTSLTIDSRRRSAVPVERDRATKPDVEASERLFGGGPARPQRGVPAPTADLDGEDGIFGPAPVSTPEATEPARTGAEPKRGLFGRRKPAEDRHGVRDWLGVDDDFDAKKAGRGIGSWDNFPDEDDDDDSGWKGGTAVIEGLDDPDFAASEAARIRRRVTMNVDRELVEKEVWFVATGAEEVGTVGMKAFLKEMGPELGDASIINLDNLGSGSVFYVTREGMAKRYDSDRRLVGAARRAAREADLPVAGREYRGLSTDATAALARRFRAVSVMAFDINGRLPNWHWATDTTDNVSEENIELAVDFVSALIKEL
jgi:hypothetical protein